MKNKICSENYRKFFSSIDKIGLKTEEIAEAVKDNIYLLADDMAIGKFICTFFAPPTPFEPKGTNAEIVLYCPSENYGEENIVHEFHTDNGGKVVFSVFPVAGHTWDEDEKDDILFICKNIFAMCGRARLSDIIKKTFSKDLNTGLENANGYVAAGNRLIREGKLHYYTAIYFNLKNFRYINGQIGNKYGDAVIKAYATAFASTVESDEIAARFGGDNFAALVKKENKDKLIKLFSGVDLDVEHAGTRNHFNISARAGIYDIQEGDIMPHVMNSISAAVNAAKHGNAGDIVIFSAEVLYKLLREQEIASNFPKAIRNKEFIVYYQPKVNLETNELCGCEALVRWNRDGKLVPPGDFIPIFEHDGNICALDFYVLERVCSDIKNWQEAGLEPVTVSVNFSKTHLHDPHVSENIIKIIEKYGIDSKYIEIELTEMSDYSDYEAFRQLVTKMKDHGIMTSIDDFGTGFSSLNLLTDFMFDIVKLDKSFLDNVIKNNSKTDEIVIRNIVKMVNELNMNAIAEGVETAEQARFLKNIDCTMVQGYFYDRPLPIEDFITRLKIRKYDKTI